MTPLHKTQVVTFHYTYTLKFFGQDIKLKNNEKENCKNRELQFWAICLVLGGKKADIYVQYVHFLLGYNKW